MKLQKSIKFSPQLLRVYIKSQWGVFDYRQIARTPFKSSPTSVQLSEELSG